LENEKAALEAKNTEMEAIVAAKSISKVDNTGNGNRDDNAPPSWLKEKNEMMQEMNELRAENTKFVEKIVKQTKEIESLKTNEISKSINKNKATTQKKPQIESPDKEKYGTSQMSRVEHGLLDWQGQHQYLGNTSNRFITLKQ